MPKIFARKIAANALLIAATTLLCACNSLNKFSQSTDIDHTGWQAHDTITFVFTPAEFNDRGQIDITLRHKPHSKIQRKADHKTKQGKEGKQPQTIPLIVRTHTFGQQFAQDTILITLENDLKKQINSTTITYKKNIHWTSLQPHQIQIWSPKPLLYIYSITAEISNARKTTLHQNGKR